MSWGMGNIQKKMNELLVKMLALIKCVVLGLNMYLN